jgi:hypothetical protein
VTLWASVPVASQADRPEVHAGSLHRYLAEGVWCPAVLYPSAALAWAPVDDARAQATLTVRGVTVSLEFRFAPTGEVIGIYTPGRWGAFDDGYRKRPWEGHFRNYQQRDGLLIPLDADVGWYVAGVWQPVWRGSIDAFDVIDDVGPS